MNLQRFLFIMLFFVSGTEMRSIYYKEQTPPLDLCTDDSSCAANQTCRTGDSGYKMCFVFIGDYEDKLNETNKTQSDNCTDSRIKTDVDKERYFPSKAGNKFLTLTAYRKSSGKESNVSNIKFNSTIFSELKRQQRAVPAKRTTKSPVKSKAHHKAVKTTKSSKIKSPKKPIKKITNKPLKKITKKAAKNVKKPAPKKTTKKSAKKAPKKIVKKTAKRTTKKAARKTTKKVVKKTTKKVAKKITKKLAEKTTKKATKKAAKKTTKKVARKPTKKIMWKTTKKVMRKPTKKIMWKTTKKAAKKTTKKTVQKTTKNAAKKTIKTNIKKTNSITKRPPKKSVTTKTYQHVFQMTKFPPKNTKVTKNTLNDLASKAKAQENISDRDFHVFDGIFKLHLTANSSDFSDKRFQRISNFKGKQCILKKWNDEVINIVFIDVIGSMTDQRNISSLKEKSVYNQQLPRFKRKSGEKADYIISIKARRRKIFSRLLGIDNTYNVSKKHESRPKFENATYRANESFFKLKPPLLKEGRKTYAEKDSLLREQAQTKFEPSTISSTSNILLKDSSDLLNFINTNLLKTGSHMLLLSSKLDPIFSDEINFLSEVSEKSLKIVVMHFVPSNRSISRSNPLDFLQLKFEMSPEMQLLASDTPHERYFTQQVKANCLTVPLLKKAVYQISSSNTTSSSEIQLKRIDSKHLLKEYASEIQGTFILNFKKPRKLKDILAASAQNRTWENNADDDRLNCTATSTDMSLSSNSQPYIHNVDGRAQSQNTDKKEINEKLSSVKHPSLRNSWKYQKFQKKIKLKPNFNTEDSSGTESINQQSVRIDYWLPEQEP